MIREWIDGIRIWQVPTLWREARRLKRAAEKQRPAAKKALL